VLVALPSEDLAKETVECLRSRGLRTAVVHDGVEAMLEIQRQRPRAVVLSATLPRMFGFQVCEVVKRNESLGSTFVVLAGAIHDKERYRRPPGELYGADAYLEEPDLPEALLPLLEREGLPVRPAGPGREASPVAPAGSEREASPLASGREASSALAPGGSAEPRAGRADDRAGSGPTPSGEGRPAGAAGMAAPAAAPPVPAADDGLGEERARAERLARIIVSDIVLYNEDRFAAAVSAGNVVEVLGPDLEEGRAHFRERVDERVRGERDHLVDELVRVARARGME
jgi:CheY-like chemotaxis protein